MRRRLNHGQPLRDAMIAAGFSIAALAAETRRRDPDGGLSTSMVGFIVGKGRSARAECSDRAAALIAEVLDEPVDSLFAKEILAPTESTSTPRESNPMSRSTGTVEEMLTVHELAKAIKKSRSWVYLQIRDRSTNGFPVEYAGNAPRFFFSEVLTWMRSQAVKAGKQTIAA